MNVFLLQLMDGEAMSHLLDQCNQGAGHTGISFGHGVQSWV